MDEDRSSSSFPTSDHTGVHDQEEVAESGICAKGPSIPPLGPWGLKQLPNSWPLAPLKCDRWAEFSWQFKHFALICVLVCILF